MVPVDTQIFADLCSYAYGNPVHRTEYVHLHTRHAPLVGNKDYYDPLDNDSIIYRRLAEYSNDELIIFEASRNGVGSIVDPVVVVFRGSQTSMV